MTFLSNEIAIFQEIHTLTQTNFKQRLRVRDLARLYKISESTLNNGFKHHYHKTIQKHRLESCMDYANVLIQKGWQVKKISYELGYKTTGSFARSYKKVYGYVPKRYAPAIPVQSFINQVP